MLFTCQLRVLSCTTILLDLVKYTNISRCCAWLHECMPAGHPECHQPPVTPVISNTRMEYSCSVCVTGRGVPSIQWNVTALPHTSAQRDTVLRSPFVCSSATLRVDASPARNGFTFECRLTFVVPLINVSNYARNAPGYHYTFTTALLSVLCK